MAAFDCDCGHLQGAHGWSASERACVGACSNCACRAYRQANRLPYATPIDGSPPACVDHEGKTARERLAEREVPMEYTRSIAKTVAIGEDDRRDCECGHDDVVHGILPDGTSPCGDPSCSCHRYLPKSWRRLRAMFLQLCADERQRREAPVPMRLNCPACGELHVDEGEFATKPHHTHACQHCGMVWRPAVVPTVGVYFLPGFKNGAK